MLLYYSILLFLNINVPRPNSLEAPHPGSVRRDSLCAIQDRISMSIAVAIAPLHSTAYYAAQKDVSNVMGHSPAVETARAPAG